MSNGIDRALETFSTSDDRVKIPGFERAYEQLNAPSYRHDEFLKFRHRKKQGLIGEEYLNGTQMDLVRKIENKFGMEKGLLVDATEYGISLLVRPRVGFSPLAGFSYAAQSIFVDVSKGEGRDINAGLFNALAAVFIAVMFEVAMDVIATRVRPGAPDELIARGMEDKLKKHPQKARIIDAIDDFLPEIEQLLETQLSQKHPNIKIPAIGNIAYSMGSTMAGEVAAALKKGTLKPDDLENGHKMGLFLNQKLQEKLPGYGIQVKVPEDLASLRQELAAKNQQLAALMEKAKNHPQHNEKPQSDAGKTGDLGKARGSAIKNFLAKFGLGGKSSDSGMAV